MNWKVKAAIQNCVSLLPSELSYEAYYRMQRLFGGLRKFNPHEKLLLGVAAWSKIARTMGSPAGKTFFEVGTGRVPVVPLSFWLMGAAETITVDLNPYVKLELIVDTLEYIVQNEVTLRRVFGPLLVEERFDSLLHYATHARVSTEGFLELCHIRYSAPGNAASTGLANASVDVHTSFAVFEHIPPSEIRDILAEGNRIVKHGGGGGGGGIYPRHRLQRSFQIQ